MGIDRDRTAQPATAIINRNRYRYRSSNRKTPTMEPEHSSNVVKGFEAPKPPLPTEDYALYAQNYRVYLELLDEFNKRNYTVNEPAVGRESINVTFAQQSQSNNIETVEHPLRKLERVKTDEMIRTTPVSASGYAEGLVSSGKLRNPSRANSQTTLVDADVRHFRRKNTERLAKIAGDPRTMGITPSFDDIERNLVDVVDGKLFEYMKTVNRLPKSYRSLNNLREMAERKCEERNLFKLSLDDWKSVARS